MCIRDAVQGPAWLWRLTTTGEGVAASSGFSFSAVARVTGPGLNEAASGCLAVSPARRNPFHSALGQDLSHDVYGSVCHLGSESGGDSPRRESLGRGENRQRTERSLQARQERLSGKFTAGVTRRESQADKTER